MRPAFIFAQFLVLLLLGKTSLLMAEDCAAMRVTTFNIRYGNKTDTDQNAWLLKQNPRRQRVIDTLRKDSPDLIGLQEVLDFQLDDLKKALPEYDAWGVGRDDGKRKGEAVPLFFKRDRFQLVEAGHFWLSETPEKSGTVFPGSGSIRMASWVRLSDRLCEGTILVLNTHWDNVSDSSRVRSGELIHKRLLNLLQASEALVLGDLNTTENNSAVRTLRGDASSDLALSDAYRTFHPIQQADEATFHNFTGRTQGERIDFILHHPAWVVLAAEIQRPIFAGLHPSDHYPVTAVLRR